MMHILLERNTVKCSSNQDEFFLPLESSETRDTSELIRQIYRMVKQATNSGIQEMNVFLENGKMVLTGDCLTFYTKQLAQEAVLKVADNIDLVNRIHVE
jgi:hypothetical protein